MLSELITYSLHLVLVDVCLGPSGVVWRKPSTHWVCPITLSGLYLMLSPLLCLQSSGLISGTHSSRELKRLCVRWVHQCTAMLAHALTCGIHQLM